MNVLVILAGELLSRKSFQPIFIRWRLGFWFLIGKKFKENRKKIAKEKGMVALPWRFSLKTW
jgi:hypothetical protein